MRELFTEVQLDIENDLALYNANQNEKSKIHICSKYMLKEIFNG